MKSRTVTLRDDDMSLLVSTLDFLNGKAGLISKIPKSLLPVDLSVGLGRIPGILSSLCEQLK